MSHIQAISDLYRSIIGKSPNSITLLTPAAAASSRKYYRLSDINGFTVIATVCPVPKEANSFIYLSEHFTSLHLPVPKIIGTNCDSTIYLQEDLGDTSLYSLISSSATSAAQVMDLASETLRCLPEMQWRGAVGLDFSQCYPVAQFDLRSAMWDLNYFKYCFLKPVLDDIDDLRLENDFQSFTTELWKMAEACSMDTFMLRDCQSRNIMIRDNKPIFIDYQGGRRGPWLYDAVSFLWQARANFSDSDRNKLLEVYLEETARYCDIRQLPVKPLLNILIAFRMMQVLGTYGFRGLIQNKSSFIASITPALESLSKALQEIGPSCRYISLLTEKALSTFSNPSPTKNSDKLTVTIGSFSYRNGIPSDLTGNGGGFVFDCRYIHNPGRYDEYKLLSGMDQPVMEFLEQDGEITEFLNHVYHIVDNVVVKYMKRGFNSLQIMFGCTGGRHRSVYSAEHTARHIKNQFDVNVRLIHREQNIDRYL